MSDSHQPSARATRLTGRIAAIALIALAIIYGLGGSVIEYAFASDPLGPRFFPVALAVALGGLSLLYFLKPGACEGFPTGPLLAKILAVPVLTIVSVALFEPAGFPAAIFVLTLGTGYIFGAPLKLAVIGAIGHAALWWFIFSYLLEVYLPAGMLFD
jgi:putative tricarboxylic transport membrane protein